jgi:ABC-2 type transport system ATP-binding protein
MTATAASSAIRVRDLRKTFRLGFASHRRLEALRGISLEVQPGQVFGFLGPNGAGKTTTIKIIAGLIFPTKGSVEILGSLPNRAEARRRFGYLPENPSFHDHLTGRELLRLSAQLVDLDPRQTSRRIDAMLELTKLPNAGDIQTRRYSKGMAQRLGIAQALLHDPELVIFDEPMSGLDPVGRRDVKELILNLRAQGKTVFFSTHIISDVEEICDHVAILIAGKVVREGRVVDLIGSGAREYEVVATGVPDALRATRAPAHVADNGAMKFLVSDEAEARRLIESLWASGARLLSLNVRKYGLEELFLSEVGQRFVGGQVQGDFKP